MRLGWSPSTRAGLLGTGAMLPCPHAPMAGSPRRQRPRARRGAEFGRSTSVGPPSRASPSSWGRSRACTDLAGRARVPAGGEMEAHFTLSGFFQRYLSSVLLGLYSEREFTSPGPGPLCLSAPCAAEPVHEDPEERRRVAPIPVAVDSCAMAPPKQGQLRLVAAKAHPGAS